MNNECRNIFLGDSVLLDYHDNEWCKINHDDQFQFEMLCLEGASVGLSWKIILNKRSAYKKAFYNFDIKKCADMSDDELLKLLKNPNLIRNKSKIFSVRKNAKIVLDIQKEFGSFDSYLWSYTNNKQIIGNWKTLKDIPTESDISKKLSADLKKRGMSFVGPIITYSFLQSVGMVNDHLSDCEYK
ncbi:DNA-3-methyladenine glycosylase I [bacterium]|nr:DNA-3-methyladenine glycosylase I [bacterium]